MPIHNNSTSDKELFNYLENIDSSTFEGIWFFRRGDAIYGNYEFDINYKNQSYVCNDNFVIGQESSKSISMIHPATIDDFIVSIIKNCDVDFDKDNHTFIDSIYSEFKMKVIRMSKNAFTNGIWGVSSHIYGTKFKTIYGEFVLITESDLHKIDSLAQKQIAGARILNSNWYSESKLKHDIKNQKNIQLFEISYEYSNR